MIPNCGLFCVVETQQTSQKVTFKDNTGYVVQMRKKLDKKGGGIMLLYRKSEGSNIEKLESGHRRDVLHTKCLIKNFSFHVIIVYFDTKEIPRNEKIKEQLTSILDKTRNTPTILLGDFNGHLGFIGEQNVNKNGNIVLDIAERYDYVILNGDPACIGEVTWSRQNQKSSIDFILCNQEMYKNFIKMEIDESKEKFTSRTTIFWRHPSK